MLVIGAALVFTATTAADVLVVTDAAHPVSRANSVRVVRLDAPASLEAALGVQLPGDPVQAETIVRRRLAQAGTDLQQQLATAYQGVADAWGLGIAKVPAVVVDRRYVVYGDPDIARAVARIHAYRSSRP
ncbi:TIGR03757 family integrating conjugative element protein [Herbaspirillum camelliae]|uniref:TIGR03757 family integrating conjugative element protein n=1 Tax=Herbaspirillum camelliae TaxID=1892903 RepID=UPI000ABC48AB|nr:TIGR03757 family integrating conjugative element protein [Herbaspirillum camelliae]